MEIIQLDGIFLISLLYLGECSPSTWMIGLGQMNKTKCCVICTWFCKGVWQGFLGVFVWGDKSFWDGEGIHTHGLHLVVGIQKIMIVNAIQSSTFLIQKRV